MVRFDRAEFSGGEVHFSRAEFSGGGVDFDRAKFSGGLVNFPCRVLRRPGRFRRRVLRRHGLLRPCAAFSGGKVYFGGAEFSGGTVSFRGAVFSGGTVDFSRRSATGHSHPHSPGQTRRPQA